VSAPTVVNSGGNKGNVKTRFFKYNYSCDSNYQNCQYLEVFSLGYQIGLYDWKYYELQNGKLVQIQESQINNVESGSATPYAPCDNSFNGPH
ncbi:MAG: hypothetical protein H0X25_09715, partial [Acidobacteriales bacterium]|nr:hypothetical protein [Terriglobales bacterium]